MMFQDNANNAPDDAADETTAGSRESNRQRRTRSKVVDYADLNPAVAEDAEIKALMDRIMDPIDRAPESFEAIITYGHPPLKKLGDIANDMMKVQGKFNEQVNIMSAAMEKMEAGMGGMNLEQMSKQAREAIMRGLKTGGKGAVGFGKTLKGIGGAIIGKTGSKKSEDDQFIADMQDALPEMLFEMIRLVKDIENTDKGIQEVMKEADKLGLARVEATREIGLYLGASKEVLRRYNEEYIPNAQKDFEESGDPEDQMLWEDIAKRKDDFLDRITILEGSRAQSVLAAQQLRQMVETMEDQRKKIQDIIFNSQNEWKAMLAAAGIAGSSLKAAQTLKKADEFGDKMYESTMEWVETAHQMTLNGKARGSVDPAKVIEGLQRMQLMLEKENEARKTRLLQLEATATQLRGATDKLIEAAESTNKARLLEASEQKEKKLEGEEPTTRRSAQPKPPAPKP